MSPRTRAALALAGVFALGIATGAGAMRVYSAHRFARLMDEPPAVARHRLVMLALDRHLDLSQEQHDKISVILSRHEPEFAEVTRSVEGQLKPVFSKIEDEIRTELSSDQRPKFDELSKRFHERRRQGAVP